MNVFNSKPITESSDYKWSLMTQRSPVMTRMTRKIPRMFVNFVDVWDAGNEMHNFHGS